jgi:hypothetical protein
LRFLEPEHRDGTFWCLDEGATEEQVEELISPAQSEKLVMMAAVMTTLACAVWGYRVLGARGLTAGLTGPLVFVMWQFHKYITRYDPVSGYFGLDKVKVLLMEVVLFLAVGAALGWIWSALSYKKNEFTAEDAEDRGGK